MSPRSAVLHLLAGLAVVSLLTGCGVPQDDEPRALDQAEAPAAALPSPSALPEPVGDERVVLYFVRAGQVVPVSRPVAMRLDAAQLLELLLDGPTPAEQQAGVSSLIPASLSVLRVEQQGMVAVVTLRGTDDQVRPQALAFAQIVATLTPERAAGVRFRLAGADLPVPRSDGLLTNAPVQRSDYADLLVGGAGPAPSPPPPGLPAPTAAGAPPPP